MYQDLRLYSLNKHCKNQSLFAFSVEKQRLLEKSGHKHQLWAQRAPSEI